MKETQISEGDEVEAEEAIEQKRKPTATKNNLPLSKRNQQSAAENGTKLTRWKQ